MKDLPKVPTWQLEWDSNLQPSVRKAPNPSHPTMYYFLSIRSAIAIHRLDLFSGVEDAMYMSGYFKVCNALRYVFSVCSDMLALACDDFMVVVVDIRTKRIVRRFAGPANTITDMVRLSRII